MKAKVKQILSSIIPADNFLMNKKRFWNLFQDVYEQVLIIINALNDAIFQDKLVSGQNIKTINNGSILGPGNINVLTDDSNYAKKTDLEEYAKEEELEDYAKEEELEYYAKKTDLEEYAKEEELEDYAKEEELEYYAKKTDLNIYATKEEIGAIKTLSLEESIFKASYSSGKLTIGSTGTYKVSKPIYLKKGNYFVKNSTTALYCFTNNTGIINNGEQYTRKTLTDYIKYTVTEDCWYFFVCGNSSDITSIPVKEYTGIYQTDGEEVESLNWNKATNVLTVITKNGVRKTVTIDHSGYVEKTSTEYVTLKSDVAKLMDKNYPVVFSFDINRTIVDRSLSSAPQIKVNNFTARVDGTQVDIPSGSIMVSINNGDYQNIIRDVTTGELYYMATPSLNRSSISYAFRLRLSGHSDAIVNKTVKYVFPTYFGFGTTYNDVLTTKNILTTAKGTYEGTASSTGVHYYLVVPATDVTLPTTFLMNGTPFVMNQNTVQIHNTDYIVYESGSVYNTGGHVKINAN